MYSCFCYVDFSVTVENEGANNQEENGEQNENDTNAKTENTEKPGGVEKTAAPVPRAVLKTRQAYAQETTPAKRKARLKDVCLMRRYFLDLVTLLYE